jgi:hypothetical protein
LSLSVGFYTFIAGNTGTGGGSQSGTAGSALTIPVTGIRATGGTGGGGTTSGNFAGGAVTALTNSDISLRRPQISDATTIHGSGGYKDTEQYWYWGGLGGWAINAGVGGNGGSGLMGSGGGGGGAGTTGGAGGNGGDGIVIITCW